jgi:hypothetical protein
LEKRKKQGKLKKIILGTAIGMGLLCQGVKTATITGIGIAAFKAQKYSLILTEAYLDGKANPHNKILTGKDEKTIFFIERTESDKPGIAFLESLGKRTYKPFVERFLAPTLGIKNCESKLDLTINEFLEHHLFDKNFKHSVITGHGGKDQISFIDGELYYPTLEKKIIKALRRGREVHIKENLIQYTCSEGYYSKSLDLSIYNDYLNDSISILVFPHNTLPGTEESYAQHIAKSYDDLKDKKSKSIPFRKHFCDAQKMMENKRSIALLYTDKKKWNDVPLFYPLAQEQPDSAIIKLPLKKLLRWYGPFPEKNLMWKAISTEVLDHIIIYGKPLITGLAKNTYVYSESKEQWPDDFLKQIPDKINYTQKKKEELFQKKLPSTPASKQYAQESYNQLIQFLEDNLKNDTLPLFTYGYRGGK